MAIKKNDAPTISESDVMKFFRCIVVPGSVQAPENRTRGKKSIRTGPGTARKSKSVLEPEPELPNAVCQF